MINPYLETVFPTTEVNWHNENWRTAGITKREHFAAMAMQGILANEHVHGPIYQDNEETVAEKAVLCADALIKALDKPESSEAKP